MDNNFNPYHEWLGLDVKISTPNYYQLLGLENSAEDAEMIATAADRAMSRVRSFKPGKNSPLWARLLDELECAKNCLIDPTHKSRYDADLATGKTAPLPENDRRPALSSGADMQFKPTGPSLASLMYPPGFDDAATSPQSPAMPVPAMPAAPTYHPYDPMAPVSPAAFASPIQSPAPYSSPYSPTFAPVAAAPTQPYAPAFDPMAPVAMPVASFAPSYPTAMSAYSPAMPQAMNPMSPLAAPVMTGVPVAGFAAVPSAVPVAQLVSPAELASSPIAVAVPVGVGVAYPAAQAAPLLAAASAPASSAPAATQTAPTPAVRSSSIRSQLSAERTRTSMQTPIILGVGGGLILLTLAIVYATIGGKTKPTDTAMNLSAKSTTTVNNSDANHGSTTKQKTPPPDHRNLKTPKSGSVTVTNIPIPPNEMTSDDDAPPPRKKPTRPQDSPQTNPNPPSPDTPTKPSETPEPKTEPKPEPKPKPVEPVTPAPEKPPEKPVPEKPEPVPAAQPQPTKEQLHALAEALKHARVALGDADPDEASRLLASVEALPKLAEHQAKFERLKQLSHYVHEFQMGYNEAVKELESTASIQIGNTAVGVVEVFPGQDKIILRVAGQNRTYRFRELPVGLAVAIADRWLTKNDGTTYLVKGAFVAAHRKSSAEMIKKSQEWWDKAERELPEVVKNLRPVLNDTYELEKDLPAEPPAS